MPTLRQEIETLKRLEKIEQMIPIGKLSEMLGVSPQHIGRLVRAGWLVRTARGQYPAIANIRGYLAYLRDGALFRGSDT
jgi:hypothetical protein